MKRKFEVEYGCCDRNTSQAREAARGNDELQLRTFYCVHITLFSYTHGEMSSTVFIL